MRTNLLLIAATLLLAFSACNKVSEEIKRDLIIRPDSVPFVITIPLSARDSVLINNLPNSINVADSITKLQGEKFGLNNLASASLSNLSITLTDTLDTKNNFANIQSIKVNLNGDGKVDSLASVTNPSDVNSRNLTLTPVMDDKLLQSYLIAGNLKYSVVIKFKRVLTKELNAKISATYTLKLSK